jgi:DNA helicase II / ATP-dependent DNA helicase PcrA
VLYRTNAQSRVIEEWCLKMVLPYKVVGGVRFYERKEVKDVLAYLRLFYNPQDNQAFERVVNTPRRGIGPKQLEDLWQLARQDDVSLLQALLQNKDKVSKQLQGFAEVLNFIKLKYIDAPLPELLNGVLERIGYVKMLSDGTLENESRVENLKEVLSVTTKYAGLPMPQALENFLNDVALVEAEADATADGDAVTLMTIHASKGLEFANVFIVGLEEGIFPHSRAYTDNKELEEERRLAYVAITRAKVNLNLTHAKSRLYFGSRQQNLVSRFAEDIPANLVVKEGEDKGWEEVWDTGELPDLVEDTDFYMEEGIRIRHELFGVGVIKQILPTSIVIDFGAVYGKKELAKAFTRLYPLNVG